MTTTLDVVGTTNSGYTFKVRIRQKTCTTGEALTAPTLTGSPLITVAREQTNTATFTAGSFANLGTLCGAITYEVRDAGGSVVSWAPVTTSDQTTYTINATPTASTTQRVWTFYLRQSATYYTDSEITPKNV